MGADDRRRPRGDGGRPSHRRGPGADRAFGECRRRSLGRPLEAQPEPAQRACRARACCATCSRPGASSSLRGTTTAASAPTFTSSTASRAPHPVVVTIHGGSWMTGYGKIVMSGLAGDLARRGYAVWNIEYRRIGRGQGGGWPATFLDVAAAIDHLRTLRAPLDLERVTILGHSAGGQLALWAAGRGRLPDGAPAPAPADRASGRGGDLGRGRQRPRPDLPRGAGRRRRRADGRGTRRSAGALRGRRPARARAAVGTRAPRSRHGRRDWCRCGAAATTPVAARAGSRRPHAELARDPRRGRSAIGSHIDPPTERAGRR